MYTVYKESVPALRIGCHVVPQYAPQFVAEALGAYQRRGVDVSLVPTRLGFGAVEALFNAETDMLLGNGLYTFLCAGTAREMLIVGDLVLRSYPVLATAQPLDHFRWASLGGKLVLVPGTNPATWVALASARAERPPSIRGDAAAVPERGRRARSPSSRRRRFRAVAA